MALPDEGFLEDLCYHAQQAAEKAVKAVYRHHKWTFRYVHVIGELLTGLERHGLDVPEHVKACAILTDYAATGRYPTPEEPVTDADYEQAIGLAEAVVRWAASELSQAARLG